MGKVKNNDINILIEEKNKKNLEYLTETAEKMSAKETPSFWRQLGAAVLADAIPFIPTIIDNVCNFVVSSYVGSREQKALALGMDMNIALDKHAQFIGIDAQPSAVSSVIAQHPKEVANIVEGAKKVAKGAAHAAQAAATNSLGGRLVAGVWNAAAEVGAAAQKHMVSETRADQKTLSGSDRKHLREHRSRHADAPVHKSGKRGL